MEEELDFFTEKEIDYIERNIGGMSFYDLCKSLRAKVLTRTGRTWSDSTLIREIKKIKPRRKEYTLTQEPLITNPKIDKERIQRMNINGYKAVKFYPNIVLFEKKLNGNIFRTCYKYCELRGV